MIHTATELRKFKRLVRELRSDLGPLPVDHDVIAVGILEKLWHAAIRECKDGRIGEKYDALDIAEAVGWHGDENRLVEMLLATEWLDDDDGTVVIHDWLKNCPNFIKSLFSPKRKKGGFAKPAASPTAAPATEPASTPAAGPSGGTGDPHHNLNQTKPNLTKPSPPPIDDDDGFLRTWAECNSRLRALKIVDAVNATREAMAAGLIPNDVWAVIDFWESSKAFSKGALVYRIKNGVVTDLPSEGWPPSSKAMATGAPDESLGKEMERNRQVKKARAAYNANPCDETRQALIDLDVPIPEVAK